MDDTKITRLKLVKPDASAVAQPGELDDDLDLDLDFDDEDEFDDDGEFDAFDDDDEEFLRAYAEADAAVVDLLVEHLGDVLDDDPPADELAQAAATLRAELASPVGLFPDLHRWAGWDDGPPPADDEDLLIDALLGLAHPQCEPVDDVELHRFVRLISALDHAAWAGAVLGVVRAGVGTPATAAALAGYAATAPEIDGELSDDGLDAITEAFELLVPEWMELGLLDSASRLTRLGRWTLPALCMEMFGPEGEQPVDPVERVQACLEVIVQARQDFDDGTPDRDQPELLAVLMREVHAAAASTVGPDPGWVPFLDSVYRGLGTSSLASGPAFLIALHHEWQGDTEQLRHWLDAAAAADPLWLVTPALLAELVSDAGDARAALQLLRRAAPPESDPLLVVLDRHARPPAVSPISRNAPCPCGSGKKYKLCCGAKNLHPLEARADWLVMKLAAFVQRPRNRERLMALGHLLVGPEASGYAYLQAVFSNPWIPDIALFDDGVIKDYLDERAALLPADEPPVLAAWAQTSRSAVRVLSVRANSSAEVEDIATGERHTLANLRNTEHLTPGSVVIGRLLPVGANWTMGAYSIVPDERAGDVLKVVSLRGEEFLRALDDLMTS